MNEKLRKVFETLNERIREMNEERRREGSFGLPRSEVTILGQMSLLARENLALVLSLAATADLDAKLKMDFVVKEEMKKILSQAGWIYDEDSPLIWIPKGAQFDELFNFPNVTVSCIDPESALVSKAVKAPAKNKQLIREAIASDQFPALADRILQNGGKLEPFS